MAGVFINYRRRTEMELAKQLHEFLCSAFAPKHQISIDYRTLAAGDIIQSRIERRIQDCDLLLVLIGHGWTSELNRRWEQQCRDDVRKEISNASAEGIPLIPILAGGAQFPKEIEVLPDRWLHQVRLDQRLALKLSEEEFSSDCQELVYFLRRQLELCTSGPGMSYADFSPTDVTSNERQVAQNVTFVPVTDHFLRLPDVVFNDDKQTVAQFEISRTPITNAQYEKLQRHHPNLPKPERPRGSIWDLPDRPLVGLTWEQAFEVAEKLGARLPTYSEWQCAAAELLSLPWHSARSPAREYGVFSTPDMLPCPVGSKLPNTLQLFDMIGNVNTWLMPEPGRQSSHAALSQYCYIGGSFMDPAGQSVILPTPLARNKSAPYIGVRLVRPLKT